MTDLGMVKEALNRTRIELREEERRLRSRSEPVNIHDVFAIFAAKLDEVSNERA